MAYPDPSQVAPWYLRNITQALALDEVTGNVYVRTDAQIGAVTITGNVNIPGNVNANVYQLGNIPLSGNTLPVNVVGNVNVTQGTTPWLVTGNTNVAITSGNVGIVGNVNVTQGTTPWSVTGNVTASLTGNALPDGKPFELQVAQGLIAGTTGLSISGYQDAVPTSWVPIWHNATAYTFPASAQQMRVWSSSGSDTDVSVLINGLDSSYNILTETVVLTNGATGVLTSNSFYRINGISLTRTPMNVGSISIGNSGKTEEYCVIEAGAGRSQQSIYSVPNGYTFYLTQVNVYTNQVGSQTGVYRSYTTSGATGVTNIILTFPFVDNYSSRKVVPRPYAGKTDIQWQCQSSNNTSRVGIQIEGYLIAN